jgi:succinate dehydrogenase / fumarate reductase flavoprotein subunit
LRCAEILHPGDSHPDLPKDSADRALARLDRFRHASGKTPTAQLRLSMQKVMQNNCAVFRTAEVLEEGHKLIHEVYAGVPDIRVTDRSLIWNSDNNWMKHTLSWIDPKGVVTVDYRPVHAYTLTNEVSYIEPRARVY